MTKSSHNLGVCQRPILDLDLQTLGHFVSYLLGLSNAHTSMGAALASVIEHTSMFCDSRLIRFHVKQ